MDDVGFVNVIDDGVLSIGKKRPGRYTNAEPWADAVADIVVVVVVMKDVANTGAKNGKGVLC
jgi:hypothetical protein